MDNIKITIETNAEQASKSFEDLAKSFNDTDNQAVDLRKQIKGLKDELYKLTPGTEEYANVLQDLGGKMDQLADTQQELKVATGGVDAVFQATTRATASMASGFQAVSGIMTLFGKDTGNLQKTFVQLQAIMSITTGLNGFAGFGKATKAASASLKAFIGQSALATKSVRNQTSATMQLGIVEKGTTTATNLLSLGFTKLTNAIKKNPIGFLLTMLTTLIALFSSLNDKVEESIVYLDLFSSKAGENTNKSYTEQVEAQNQQFEHMIEALRSIGVSEDELNDKRISHNNQQLEYLEKRKQMLEENKKKAEEYGTIEYKIISRIFKGLNPALVQSKKELEDIDKAIQQINDETDILVGKPKTPELIKSMREEVKKLDEDYELSIAGGLATQGDYLQAKLEVFEKAYRQMYDMIYAPGSGRAPRKQREGTEHLKTDLAKLEAEYRGIERQLSVYNATMEKQTRDSLNSLRENLINNYKDLIGDIENEAKELKEAWNKSLSDFVTSDILNEDERSGRVAAQVFRYQNDLKQYIENWRKLGEKAANDKDIANLSQFMKDLKNIEKVLIDSNNSFLTGLDISEPVYQAGMSIIDRIEKFKTENENMLSALDGGLITKEEYWKWLEQKMDEYKKITDEVVNTNNPLEEIFIKASKTIIPPEVKTQMDNSLNEYRDSIREYYDNIVKEIDKAYDNLEDEYNNRIIGSRKMLENKWDDEMRSWIEGGTNTSYWGDSAGTTLSKMQQQAEELYNSLHEEYTREIQLLEEKKLLLDENSEAYAKYFKKLEELRQADADALAAYDAATIANTRQYNQDVLQLHVELADSLSGLAGAMGSYYTEQKEWARETYGENSKEYEKYLKREGAMKIAQVWTDAAAGIMTAWATSEQLGPIAGPIMAALQTAALTATATASTLQIKRQTKTNASGGEANVSGITDRVIFGQEQNADQRAQLNAEYNQGATRVFVVESDINDAQGKTRTAVLNNKF